MNVRPKPKIDLLWVFKNEEDGRDEWRCDT